MHCGFIFTNPRPDDKDLDKYYISDNYISHTDSNSAVTSFVRKKIIKPPSDLDIEAYYINPYWELNPQLEIRGVLLTMYDKRNKLSAEVDKEARNFFKDKVYKTVIPRNVRLSEAPSHGIPVLIYDKTCSGSKSYSSFTDEFLKQENIMESAA